MEMNALSAIEKYASSRPATAATGVPSDANPFQKAALDFATTLAEGEATAKAAMSGDADPHAGRGYGSR